MNESAQPPPVLSICIPTYNRPEQFKRLANCLLLQEERGNVEIVIRDDSPNENTRKIVEEILSPTGINIRYFSGEKIGLDAANIFLIENATGKFIWWFSDDDEMRPGAVSHVLDLIRADNDLRYIWANFDFGKDGSPAVTSGCRYFKSGDETIVELGTNIGLLSTHIFHRETALEATQLAKQNLMGFAFAGLIPIFHVITSPGNYYLLGTTYILCNPTENEEVVSLTVKNGEIVNKAFDVYGVHFKQVVMLFRGRFSDPAIRKALSTNFASLWRGMLVGWIGGWDTPDGKRLRMLKLYWSYPECWVALLLFCLPRSVVTALYKIYKIFYSHRRFVFIDRLRALWGT
jgi:glycosyltransferase involved in cell wall biosynthesis